MKLEGDRKRDLSVPRVLGYDREINVLKYSIQTLMPGVAPTLVQPLRPRRGTRSYSTSGDARVVQRLEPVPRSPSSILSTRHASNIIETWKR